MSARRLYAVQVREPGMKRWEFLAGGGQLTASPVHAAVTPRAVAREVASMIEARYPDTRARAVRSGADRIRSRPGEARPVRRRRKRYTVRRSTRCPRGSDGRWQLWDDQAGRVLWTSWRKDDPRRAARVLSRRGR